MGANKGGLLVAPQRLHPEELTVTSGNFHWVYDRGGDRLAPRQHFPLQLEDPLLGPIHSLIIEWVIKPFLCHIMWCHLHSSFVLHERFRTHGSVYERTVRSSCITISQG
jgi:hypothetical protein